MLYQSQITSKYGLFEGSRNHDDQLMLLLMTTFALVRHSSLHVVREIIIDHCLYSSKSHSLQQWFSNRVPRNPRLPPAQTGGSARRCINAMVNSKFQRFCADMLVGVLRTTRMLPRGSVSLKRLKTTALQYEYVFSSHFFHCIFCLVSKKKIYSTLEQA